MGNGVTGRVWIAAMAGVIAAVQIAHLLTYGGNLLISPDSISYIAAARSLVAGNGLVVHDGSPLIFWPPLYPVLLSAFHFLGLDLVNAAAGLNAISFGLIAFTCGLWLRSRTGSDTLGAIGVALILVSRPLWYTHIFVWTEPLFALLVIWSLLVLQAYLDGAGRRLFLAAAALCAIACLVRYPGVFLIGACGLALLFRPGAGWWRRIGDAVFFGLLAVAPIFLWWWWSVGSTEDPGGQRILADRPLHQGLWDLSATLGNWFVPWSIPTLPKLAILLTLAIVLVLWLGPGRSGRVRENGRRPVRASALGWFVLVYGLGVPALAVLLSFDLVRDRVLSPLYAPLAMWCLVWVWNRSPKLEAGRWKRLASACVLVLIGFWVGRSALVTSRMVNYEHRHADDYSKGKWQESEMLRYLAENPPDELLCSNFPHAVYLYTRIHTLESPREHYFDARRTKTVDLVEFRKVVQREGEILMAWFPEEDDDYHYMLGDLRQHFDFEPVLGFADGQLYRVIAK